MLRIEQLLPTILILLDLGAGAVYLYKGNVNMLWYWVSAASITASVTFVIN